MTRPEPTARDRGLARALELQRRADPRTWRREVDAIEDPQERAVADQYLRDILTRMKAVSRLARDNRRP